MKFLLMVLAVHFFGAMINGKRNKKEDVSAIRKDKAVRHPAEFEVR